MKNKFLLLYSWFIRSLLFFLPDIPLIMRFRGWLYGLGMKKCGKDFQVPHDVIIRGLGSIVIGNHVLLGNGAAIIAVGMVTIEDEVLIALNVAIVSGNHTKKNGSYRFEKGQARGEIRIGKGAWIAANCTIAKDSALPQGSVLSANSFLNKNYDVPDAIYGGVPAKYIKNT